MTYGSVGAYESFGGLSFEKTNPPRNHEPPKSAIEALGRYALPNLNSITTQHGADTHTEAELRLPGTIALEKETDRISI